VSSDRISVQPPRRDHTYVATTIPTIQLRNLYDTDTMSSTNEIFRSDTQTV
jgi:hypothetical protein